MVKFSILFHNPIDPDAFENRYNDLLALLERMPALIRRQVVNVIGSPQGPSPYFRVFEAYFEDEDAMRAALMSPAGQEAGAELFRFPQGTFETFFAHVYEEAGGYTETQDNHAGA
ncbi:MAG: EthD family reductase [Chloroflexota bacterium]